MNDVAIWLVKSQWKQFHEQICNEQRVRMRVSFHADKPRHAQIGDRIFVVAHNRIQGYGILEEVMLPPIPAVQPEYDAQDKRRKGPIRRTEITRASLHLKRKKPAIVFLIRKPWVPCTEWDYQHHMPKPWPPFLGYRYPIQIDTSLVEYPNHLTPEADAQRKSRTRKVAMYLDNRYKIWLVERALTPAQRVLLSWGNGKYIPHITVCEDKTIIALLNKGTYDVRSIQDPVRVQGSPPPVSRWKGVWSS